MARHETERIPLLGWGVSTLIHGGVLVVVAAFNVQVSPLRTVPQKEPFQWDVSFISAPRTEAIVADAVPFQEAGEAAEIYPEETAHREVDTSVVSSMELPDQQKTTQVMFRQDSAPQSPIAPETPPKMNEGFNAASARSLAGPVESVLPLPDVESQTDSRSVQVPAQLEQPVVLQRPPRTTRTVFSKTVLPDYTWLMDSLRTKLERVKVYPSLARTMHAQGRVVVQVSIQAGGHLVNPEVMESSGYRVLDQAALDALRAASPLDLDHDLNSVPILMVVPLNYQLE